MNFPKLKKYMIKHFKVVAIVGIAILLIGYLAYQIYFDKPQYVVVRIKGSPGNWWWVTPRPPDWLAESVKVGDAEYNAMNHPTATVMNVDVYDAGGNTKDVYLTTKIEAKYNKRTQKYTYKGEPLQIGGPISLDLKSTFFPGMVVEIGDAAAHKKYIDKTVKVRYYSRWPFEFDSIKIGDKIYDGEGNIIAEIMDKQAMPAEKEEVTTSGQIVRSLSPVYDDFFITINLKVEQKNDGFVFREDQYLKVGNGVWILFPHYNFSGAIIYEMD
jgi:hypothetical protein